MSFFGIKTTFKGEDWDRPGTAPKPGLFYKNWVKISIRAWKGGILGSPIPLVQLLVTDITGNAHFAGLSTIGLFAGNVGSK